MTTSRVAVTNVVVTPVNLLMRYGNIEDVIIIFKKMVKSTASRSLALLNTGEIRNVCLFKQLDMTKEEFDKTRWWGTSYSLETDQFEVSFSDTINCIPKLTMIIKCKIRNGKKLWRSQVVRYVCNGIYYKNEKDLLDRCEEKFEFYK